MQNFDIARSALETSLKSSGSAMREHEKASQSLEFKLNALKAAWQSLSQTFLDTKFLKNCIDGLVKFVDIIDSIIDRFGIIGTGAGILGLREVFKNGFAIDENGNQIAKYSDMFKVCGQYLESLGSYITRTMASTGKFGDKLKVLGGIAQTTGQNLKNAFTNSKSALSGLVKDIAKVVVLMNAMKAIQDIISWATDAGKEAETTAEKFDRISGELSDVESELNGLESELSTVENQIDALLGKDELTFADEEELARLRNISSELERQIKLAETLQESLNKSLSLTALDAYNEYANDTSFYSAESKQERKEAAKQTGNSIGNIVGLIGGAALAYFTGGVSTIVGAAIGSTVGSLGGGILGGVISDSSYDTETTVSEMLDKMHLERTKLERAQRDAYKAYAENPTDNNRESWEEATTALNDYNTALADHITQLSEYYDSIDYNALDTKEQRDEYLKMGDILDRYNIEMGVQGAKSTALDRIFSEELVTKEAEELKTAIQVALDSGEEISFENFDSDKFVEMKERLADMGITLTDVISYFRELEEVQADAFDYDTYDIVSNIATLSDGVTSLTDAFVEFNEQGTVSAKTLAGLNEVFGNAGEAWTNYVDIMSNGISSIEDAREATEQLAEAHLDNLLSNGGIKFGKLNQETGKYEFDQDNYKTYLSTIGQLENIGVENAKEYVDALQQREMIEEAAAKMREDSKKRQAILEKEGRNRSSEERELLSELNSKLNSGIDYYVQDIEDVYNVPLKDTSILEKQYNLDEYNAILKDREEALSEMSGFFKSYEGQEEVIGDAYEKYLESSDKVKELENQIADSALERSQYTDSGLYIPTWNDFEGIDDLFGTNLFNTDWDAIDKASEDTTAHLANYEDELGKQTKMFNDMVDIAKEMDIDLSDIIDVDNFNFDPKANNAKDVFKQVYDRVKSELELSVDEYEKLADDLSAEIEAAYENLGLDIDFGRYFDKMIMDGFKTKVDQIGTARTEMFSTGGLSTDSIISIDKIFGDLNSYDSSKLFENTANGVRLNAEEFRRLNNEFKNTNIDGLEDRISDLGDQYVKTREELYSLTYGTEEYNAKARELSDIEGQIAANEELLSSYKGLFSAFQEWQRAESSGSERNMYETILGGFEGIGDEISRGWIDDGTREFLELLKGDTATVIDGNGVAKEINIATASAKDLKQVWKDLDKNIEHTSYSVRDFFTVDEDGNSTSDGVKHFLDAIGQMEEEKFGGKDVVKRRGNEIIGFDFQLVGGDKAIAEALGVSEELVQIMKRAAIDAGFVVNFDGSYESLDVLREKAEAAAKTMNEKLEKAGKATIDIDMNADSVEDIQSQLDKIMATFGEKDGNGKLTGAINMDISGAEEAVQVASTLQSMVDKLTRPAYMDIQISQVDEELREPLQNLQDYRTQIERLNQAKLRGADTTELEASIKESKEKVVADLLEIQESNPKLAAELEIDGLTKEEIEKKVETGEIVIPATIDIQLEMAESLDILALTALKEHGLISDEEYVKRVNVYLETEVDNEGAKNEVEDAVDEVAGDEEIEKNIDVKIDTSKIKELLNERGIDEDHQVKILAMAEVFGAEDLDELYEKLDGLTNKQIQVLAEVLGRVDVEKLKTTVAGLDDKTVEAIAKALGEGDVEGLKTTIMGLDDKTVQAIAEAFGFESVDELDKAIDNLDPKTVQAIAEALGITDVDSLRNAVNRLTDKNVKATATTVGENKLKNLKKAIDEIKDKTVTITTKVKQFFTKVFGGDDEEGGGGVNGTANANGTTGRAFKQGSWGTKNSGTALVGELGRETLVRGGKYYTIGNNGAEFIKYQKGDIIFNHKQTEELFKHGRVTSGGGRAKALVNGTAFANGLYPSSGAAFNNYQWDGYGSFTGSDKPSFKVGYDYSSGDSEDESKKSQEIFDWIEVAIKRIEREIDNLDTKASSVYRSWSERNEALVEEINGVGNEIALQEKAIAGYQQALNEINLSQDYIDKIESGAIDIDNITDETLAEKISDYQKWYEKILDAKDAILELQEKEKALYQQRFDNVATQYEGMLSIIEHEKNMLDEYIAQSEAQAHLISENYYNALISNEEEMISKLQAEKSALIAELNTQERGTEQWYENVAAIDEVTLSITQCETAILEWQQSIEQLKFEQFDLLQEKISAITEEADFLIELLSSDKLFDDKGKLTDEGSATLGLHGQNYNVYMHQADQAAAEAERIKKELDKDPYDTDLEARYREMIALQQEHILAAEGEKEAIRDLVEEGIETQLDSLQELIDKKNELLDSERDLYEYQKKVKEQTKEIASLEKQLSAYEDDDSEEAQAKIQQIKVDLEAARQDLEETETDRLIESTAALLDNLYLEYEEILNTRLDNLDALIADVIAQINADATSISETLTQAATDVGYNLSTEMSNIWSTNTGNITNVITTYGNNFSSAQTTTNIVLGNIKTDLSTMISQLNKIANTNAKSAANSSAGVSSGGSKTPVTGNNNNNNNKNKNNNNGNKGDTGSSGEIKVGGKINAGSAQIYDYAGDTSGERQLYRNDPIYNVLRTDGNWIQVRYHKLSSGVTGWFKKSDVKAYATGARRINSDDVAWTQEDGQEFIVRPSDGAILTPVAKNDSVLNAQASRNIWNMANSPAEFIKGNLNLGSGSVPNNSTSQNVYSQHLDKVVFNFPNVHSYDEMLSQMQKDKSFEKLITAMTVDRLAGKSALAKGKTIR